MATASPPSPVGQPKVRGKIIDAVVKVSVDPTRPLPLVCGLYEVESSDGVWLCAYYGANRSVFDFLPQKDADIDESNLGIAFHHKRFIPRDEFQPAQWEEFKKTQVMAYGGHGD